jgi:hypothetical protein
MLSTIMALLGAIGGGALRIAPLLIDAWQHRNDPTHDLEMAKIELEKTKAELDNKVALATAQAQASDAQARASIAESKAQAALAAQQAQAHLTGIPFVDGANLLVRPVVTLWLLLLYTLYKVITVYAAITQHATLDDVAGDMWTPDDVAIFAGAITFWFVDESISNAQHTPRIPKPPKVQP